MAVLLQIGRDSAAFETFYREHIERVQRFIARRVDDPYLAADLTAEVFVAAINSAHSYRPARGTPTGWLYGVAQNVVSAERRRQTRELRANQRFSGRRLLTPDDVSRMEDRIDAEAQARQLLRAMDDLPAGERAVLELVALDGISPHEAAQVLGIRASTARVRLHRARARLRDAAPPLAISSLADFSSKDIS
ncbi:sigma-70 family RNA polymerase sigma factor [Kribbella sancticallisti]|uniref:Sigma-70 family RNA polymerase sigma factor n=1 Tax=Kribbella sancticallisti TaxID=460087 RepID=A0ABP4PM40_9ACTN